ncbi:MAG: 5-(carboxyamino)imidazole ribonucleotide synthase [Gammaproteobacteria bacterium]
MKVGILGAGQLARMLTLAAKPMGIDTISFVENPNEASNGITPIFHLGWHDPNAFSAFSKEVSVLTFETENIPTDLFNKFTIDCPVYPNIKTLKITQDRLLEKEFLTSLQIPTAEFIAIESIRDLSNYKNFPAILKTRCMGYDGKGQFLIRNTEEAQQAFENLKTESLILESFVQFDLELSLIAIRSVSQETKFYPLTQNQHREGILFLSEAPLIDPPLQRNAETIANKILDAVDYVGVLAIEMFQVGDQLLINELAPRVHNSGHWTIEGAVTSQFENHIRAILDLPLGSTEPLGYSAMINMIGNLFDRNEILKIPYTHWHDYEKSPRPNRKLGHITLNVSDKNIYNQCLEKILA